MAFQQSDYHISVMSRDELQIAVDWANTEGWNPGLDDAASFYAADPQGFLIGRLDNRPIATISAVKYGNSFGFVGLYIVEKSYRQKGYGIQIWNRALEYLKGRNVGLDGVVAQQENYKKSGFKLAHRNIRFAGLSRKSSPVSANMVSLSSLDFGDLCGYDRQFFPERRECFLKAWINQPDCHALGIVENGKLSGYGVIRACRTGYKIGPLNAEDKDLAIELFNALTSRVPPGSALYLDTPEPNARAIDVARLNGMEPSFETARMYTGSFPDIALDKVFGITTFELG
ncbi:Acetyltransferase (GNAT) domain-containing protein [Azotobacter beijerinckii]|uniref:Acetyltransferase (GNAT) domain-containing protein n=2 Tax=Azotobacter beijerinckii TaxID=170623 RepID=A0A1H6XTF6_9GAMM|nr:Acetyltransferase (GNAT) domain-containing protein [Azotobacter beijerinckii]